MKTVYQDAFNINAHWAAALRGMTHLSNEIEVYFLSHCEIGKFFGIGKNYLTVHLIAFFLYSKNRVDSFSDYYYIRVKNKKLMVLQKALEAACRT